MDMPLPLLDACAHAVVSSGGMVFRGKVLRVFASGWSRLDQ